MKKPIIQLANTRNIRAIYTAHETPIWRTRLWIYDYIKTLPFMAFTDSEYNRTAVNLSSLVIDFMEFARVYDVNELRQFDKSWMLNPTDISELWIHFEDHKPPSSFISFKSGLLMGFSYNKSETLGTNKTYPLLLDIPDIEDQADLSSYQHISFSTDSVSIENSTGILDDHFDLFGSDIDLLELDDKNHLEEIRQYFIESYSIGLTEASFNIKDKRAKFAFNAPVETYTKEKYPFIDDKEIDKIMIDAYGYCKGVPGTCTNRNQIYINPQSTTFNNHFEFKFARKITSIEEVWVKMSDVWTQVFPGLGIPGNNDADSPDRYLPINPNQIALIWTDQNDTERYEIVTQENKNTLGTYNNDGRIRIWWSQAMRDNPGFLYRRNGDANEVKMNGVFVDLHNPGEIIKDLLVHYGNLTNDNHHFDNEEWARETEGMRSIGICLDSSKSVFDWIGLIQNGSMIGFQVIVYKNLFSIRTDNANREVSFNIRWIEILNKDEISPEINGEHYATFTTINYHKDYTDDESLTITNKTLRLQVLDHYKFEKEYTNDCFISGYNNMEQTAEERVLQAAAHVSRKGRIILENFTKMRIIIRNIELEGLKWDTIKLFSTGYIDFNMELPRQMKIVQRYMKTRNFLRQLRVKVIKCRRVIKENKTFIDVIQCDTLGSLEEAS